MPKSLTDTLRGRIARGVYMSRILTHRRRCEIHPAISINARRYSQRISRYRETAKGMKFLAVGDTVAYVYRTRCVQLKACGKTTDPVDFIGQAYVRRKCKIMNWGQTAPPSKLQFAPATYTGLRTRFYACGELCLEIPILPAFRARALRTKSIQ